VCVKRLLWFCYIHLFIWQNCDII